MTPGAKPGSGFTWPEALCASVRSLPDHTRLWVAFSGGLDSTLLLHLAAYCHRQRVPVGAIHINHQLQPNADDTEAFCRAQSEALAVPLITRRVTVLAQAQTPGGIEEAAREARYGVFRELLGAGDLLLMAHHADDQAETVLFRLLRGSGVAGLAGMPAVRSLGGAQLARPLLCFERQQLAQCAAAAGLDWREDPSNQDPVHDRNYLRHAVLPGLKARWQGLTRRLRYSAGACAEADFLSGRLAELQWQDCSDGDGCLRLDGLRSLTLVEQKNLLHWWVRERGFVPPTVANWPQVMGDLLDAGEDREPELRGAGYQLRRFRGRLYLVPELVPVPEEPLSVMPGDLRHWGDWTIALEPANPDRAPEPIRVSTRQGGERLREHPEGPSKALKKWLQEQAVPPWQRARLPLVFAGSGASEELIAVGDLWCSERYAGGAPAAGWRLIVARQDD